MILSDAQPIQFWRTGTDSFNTRILGYTDDYCFHQKFRNTRTIPVSITGDAGYSYDVVIYENDVEIYRKELPWVYTLSFKGTFIPSTDLSITDGEITAKIERVGMGTAFESESAAAALLWYDVAYGNGLFVAVAQSGTGNRVMTSPDGETWTSRVSAADVTWRGITYSEDHNLFVAVAGTGANRVMTSPDGITWTIRSVTTGNWFSVSYGNGLFVAVASDSNVMYSSDGITWTIISPFSSAWYGITYGNGKFVAVGSSIITSTDGINWTESGITLESWNDVAYGKGRFVMVSALDGLHEHTQWSDDGVTWNEVAAVDSRFWVKITYGADYFVAIAASGTGNRAMRSTDGLSWASITTPADNVWTGIAYGNGLFVAVSADGTDRVMRIAPTKTEVAYSDEVIICSTWEQDPGSGSVFIQYRSIQNFDWLIWNSSSDYSNIELEGRFRKERKITAQKTLELTGMVLNTAASLKRQRKLTLDDLPDYMHTKVELILAHAASGSVLIDGVEWSLEESYDEGDRPESYPMQPAEVWLTEKEYYKHNVT